MAKTKKNSFTYPPIISDLELSVSSKVIGQHLLIGINAAAGIYRRVPSRSEFLLTKTVNIKNLNILNISVQGIFKFVHGSCTLIGMELKSAVSGGDLLLVRLDDCRILHQSVIMAEQISVPVLSLTSSSIYLTVIFVENNCVSKVISCNCPGWTKRSIRECKHTKHMQTFIGAGVPSKVI